jgi:protein-S-isoprenylcysteine O-methyltransferase Ste14
MARLGFKRWGDSRRPAGGGAQHLSVGHLLFAAAMTLCIGIGVRFEERDLALQLGDDYRRYQQQVPRLVPAGPRRRRRER